MSTHEYEPEQSTDALESAAAWSKVSPKKTKNLSHFYWLGGGVLALLLVSFMSWHRAEPLEKQAQASPISSDYSASLNANLARLKALRDQLPAPTFPSDHVIEPLAVTHVSKEYLARQNAPTSMYSGSVDIAMGSQAKSNSSQATFSDNGANAGFANSHATTATVEAKTIPHPDFTIASGEFLHAVLETAIHSDLPGMVRAVVSKPIYSYTGEHIIISAGSRLMGQYSSAVIQGQNRVMVIWNRVVLPNGITVQLNSPGTDALGRAGQGADSVNRHFIARFGEAALLSLIGAGVSVAGVNNQEQFNSAAQYRMAVAKSFQESAGQSLQNNLPMKPTLHIHQGANINVFVAHDLSFYQVLKNRVEAPQPLPSFIK